MLIAPVAWAISSAAPAAARHDVAPTVDASIINGTPTTAAEWPFLVQLADSSTEGSRMSCTASVISPTWVLTAAHCVATADPLAGDGHVTAVDPAGLRVFAGGDLSFTGEARAVRRVVMHPQWQPGEFLPDNDGDGEPDDLDDASDLDMLDFLGRLGAYDLALLELASPVSATPVRLATGADGALVEPGDVASVIGWGSVTADDQAGIDSVIPASPRRATLRLLDPASVGVEATGPLAVFARGSGQGVCHGDSGGPLVVAGADGQLRLAGVTSSGLACAPSEPSGAQFGNVAASSSWIAGHVIDLPSVGARTPSTHGTEGERAPAFTGTELGRFSAVTPWRLVDSRTMTPLDEDGDPLSFGQVQATGMGGVPAGATGLLVNVTTVAGPDSGGRGAAGSCDGPGIYWSGFRDDTGPVAWTTVMPLGPTGTVCFAPEDAVIIVDVLGWFGPSGTDLFGGSAARLVDTRVSGATVQPGTPIEVSVKGAGSAVLNVTAIAGRRSGHVIAHPCATGPGSVSTVNVERREIRSNLTVVPVSPAGTVCVSTSTAMHLVVDQVGVMAPGTGSFVSVETELYEDFSSFDDFFADLLGEDDDDDAGYRMVEVAVDDTGLVPPGARSVVLDVILDNSVGGYATVYACDEPAPAHSTVNVNGPASIDDGGAAAEGLTIVELGSSRSVCVLAPVDSNLSIALQGWFR